MTFEGDPYRTLGVAPGASLNELKSAYRRLVKKYHPDAAGERALPRFLAIQAAYETLVDGEGRLRPAGGSSQARPGSGGGASPGSGPWRADPGRARASRDAWRARRSGSGGTAGYRPASGASGGASGAGGASGSTSGASGSTTGPRGAAEPGPGGGSSRPRGPGERHHRRGRRTATPGSTTYDEASETPLDPEWDGGAWYGPSSGTYWTLNPREYADPRKHGPEYLARARRAATGAGTPGADPDDAGADPDDAGADPATFADDPDSDPADEGWEWTGTAQTRTSGSAGAWRARAWTYEASPGDNTAWTPGRAGRDPSEPPWARRASSGPGTDGSSGFPDLEALARRAFPESLLALARRPDPRWRLLLAFIAWPPIGYALGGLVGAATGCARYSATCPEAAPILVFAAQPFIVAGLFLAPPVAAVAAFAALAALAMALPAGAVLAVGALPRPVIEPTVLGIIVAVTYAIAWIAAVVRLRGLPRDGDRTAGRAP